MKESASNNEPNNIKDNNSNNDVEEYYDKPTDVTSKVVGSWSAGIVEYELPIEYLFSFVLIINFFINLFLYIRFKKKNIYATEEATKKLMQMDEKHRIPAEVFIYLSSFLLFCYFNYFLITYLYSISLIN